MFAGVSARGEGGENPEMVEGGGKRGEGRRAFGSGGADRTDPAGECRGEWHVGEDRGAGGWGGDSRIPDRSCPSFGACRYLCQKTV